MVSFSCFLFLLDTLDTSALDPGAGAFEKKRPLSPVQARDKDLEKSSSLRYHSHWRGIVRVPSWGSNKPLQDNGCCRHCLTGKNPSAGCSGRISSARYLLPCIHRQLSEKYDLRATFSHRCVCWVYYTINRAVVNRRFVK